MTVKNGEVPEAFVAFTLWFTETRLTHSTSNAKLAEPT